MSIVLVAMAMGAGWSLGNGIVKYTAKNIGRISGEPAEGKVR